MKTDLEKAINVIESFVTALKGLRLRTSSCKLDEETLADLEKAYQYLAEIQKEPFWQDYVCVLHFNKFN